MATREASATRHTHLCPRCGAEWCCAGADCLLLVRLCAPCDERVYGATHASAEALDGATRSGALVRCGACRRLHGAEARHGT